MNTDEQAVYAAIREIREMLALGGLSAPEEAGLKARLRRLSDEYGDPPDEPPLIPSLSKDPAPPSPDPIRSDPIRSDPILVGAEDRTSLWLRLAELNESSAIDDTPGCHRERDRIARKLGLAA